MLEKHRFRKQEGGRGCHNGVEQIRTPVHNIHFNAQKLWGMGIPIQRDVAPMWTIKHIWLEKGRHLMQFIIEVAFRQFAKKRELAK